MQYLPYLLIPLALLPLLLQLRVFLRERRLRGQDAPSLEGPMDAKLRARGRVLLYFYSPSCGPCRSMTPVVDRLAESRDNVFKFDVSATPDMARRFNVMATPTTVLVQDGRIAQVMLGPQGEKKLAALLG